jgi:hypothetical protein
MSTTANMPPLPGQHAIWRGHGRVYVESVFGEICTVRLDCGDGMRGPEIAVHSCELDTGREWRELSW